MISRSAVKSYALALGLALTAGLGTNAAYAGCMRGDHVDSSTAAQATHKFEKAGYSQVRDLKKGCDNFWHGTAMQDGKRQDVVLAPDGNVMLEGQSLEAKLRSEKGQNSDQNQTPDNTPSPASGSTPAPAMPDQTAPAQ